jgi:hypothetical protein
LLVPTAWLQIFDHKLPWSLELLPQLLTAAGNAAVNCIDDPKATAAAAAAAAGADNSSSEQLNPSSSSTVVRCIKLVIGLTEALLQGGGSWKRSPAAALLFKLLKPMASEAGRA